MSWRGFESFRNMPQKLPMLFGQTPKVEVGKDIAQQDQPFKTDRLQEGEGCARLADLRTKVQVGDNYRVKAISLHALYL